MPPKRITKIKGKTAKSPAKEKLDKTTPSNKKVNKRRLAESSNLSANQPEDSDVNGNSSLENNSAKKQKLKETPEMKKKSNKTQIQFIEDNNQVKMVVDADEEDEFLSEEHSSDKETMGN